MKSLKIVLKNAKDAGLEQAEKAIVGLYGSLEKSCPEILADAETSSLEKTAAGILIPVLSSLKPSIEKLADLDKDGQVG